MSQSAMSPSDLINALNKDVVDFSQVIATIENYYEFTPVTFHNGSLTNEAGSNLGSCKIFAFAQLNGLSKQATLNAFGAFYTEDVLKHPEAQDHQNIRNFMNTGWEGVVFEGPALKPKQGE